MEGLRGKLFFCSWSGGKDSCLALYHALNSGGIPGYLFTMLAPGGERSQSHGVPLSLLERQAAALGVPLVVREATFEEYEEVFVDQLRALRALGVEAGVFGDIDLPEHRAWQEKVCAAAGIAPFLPLWQKPRRELARQFVALGFTAVIVAVRRGVVPVEFLGRPFDGATIAALEGLGIDTAGEAGEFHTFVTGGPVFRYPVSYEVRGVVAGEFCSFLDVC